MNKIVNKTSIEVIISENIEQFFTSNPRILILTLLVSKIVVYENFINVEPLCVVFDKTSIIDIESRSPV